MKKISLFWDGTGANLKENTNVTKIYNALKTSGEDLKWYDPGIASFNDPYTKGVAKTVAEVFGIGHTENMVQGYLKLCLSYEDGDQINIFGYSRGAYTARCFAGLITRFGLLPKTRLEKMSPRQRRKLARKVIAAYRSDMKIPDKYPVNERLFQHEIPIYTIPIRVSFLGVFDTVDSVGIPFDEIRSKVTGVYRKLFKRRPWGFFDNRLSSKVTRGVQALAIDETRRTFEPNIWEEAPNVHQRWFAGVHGDVGGFEGNIPSLNPLLWMIDEAQKCGLEFHPHFLVQWRASENISVRLESPKNNIQNIFMRFRRRILPKTAEFDVSVLKRIIGNNNYSPKNIPKDAKLVFVTKNGGRQTFSRSLDSESRRIMYSISKGVKIRIERLLAMSLLFLVGGIATSEAPLQVPMLLAAIPEIDLIWKAITNPINLAFIGIAGAVFYLRTRIYEDENEFFNLVWNRDLSPTDVSDKVHNRITKLQLTFRRYDLALPSSLVSLAALSILQTLSIVLF